MKRLIALASLLVFVALVIAMRPAEGQDNLQDRVSALETRVAALENALGITATPTPSATPNRLDGTVTLVGSTAVEIRTPSPREPGTVCQGAGLYSDIRAKTQLRLQDDTGRVLGTGTLGHGAYSVGADTEPRCTFSFFVSQVPAHPSYTITIGTRVVFTFTFEELQASG